jgi:hypothetical protein
MFPKMNREQWDATAQRFADHMGQYCTLVERGVAPIRFLEENSMTDIRDCPVVVGVFGNDNQQAEQAQREIELVRDRALEIAATPLGFGLSSDGATWALILGVENSRYQTRAGQTLQRELLKTFFEEAVWSAWRQTQYEHIQLALSDTTH